MEFPPFWYHSCEEYLDQNLLHTMKTFVFATFFLALFQLGFSQSSEAVELESYTGTFSSKRGVMHQLSCHCFDGGYLTTEGGDKIAVCFEKGELEEVQSHFDDPVCKKMKVTGEMIQHYLPPAKGGPCSGGSMTYLKVRSFTCLD